MKLLWVLILELHPIARLWAVPGLDMNSPQGTSPSEKKPAGDEATNRNTVSAPYNVYANFTQHGHFLRMWMRIEERLEQRNPERKYVVTCRVNTVV